MFISDRGHARHDPRIKVSNIKGKWTDDKFVVTVEHDPRVVGKCKISNDDLNDVIDWVKINLEHLSKVWKDKDMYTEDQLAGLVKL